jgi:hypothetical protein
MTVSHLMDSRSSNDRYASTETPMGLGTTVASNERHKRAWFVAVSRNPIDVPRNG